MMFSIDRSAIYLYQKPIHINKSFEGLSTLVQDSFPGQLLTGRCFIFLNRYHNKMKILYWDSDGFVIFYKRLEKGSFYVSADGKSELSRREFLMLFEGIKPLKLEKRFSLKK